MLSNIPLYEYATLFIHTAVDVYMSCFQFEPFADSAAMNILAHAHSSTGISESSCVHNSNFASKCQFSKVVAPIYAPLNTKRVPCALYPSQFLVLPDF